MAQHIIVRAFGGPEQLMLEGFEIGEPGLGEVRVRQYAIGVNFADISLRAGRFPAALPVCPGSEAAGVVDAVGPGVSGFRVGDRVAYGASDAGSYADIRIVPQDILVALRDDIAFETAAGMMSAGLTAGYLLRRMWPLRSGDTILFTAAAGGVGQIAVQWAKALGMCVIGTVGSPEKIAIARSAGCDHVLLHNSGGMAAEVRDLTGGEGVAVAFDSVGADTLQASLKSVRKRGLLVSFGAASGPPPEIPLLDLVRNGSLFLSRPSVHDYVADPADRVSLTGELMDHVAAGRIGIRINHRYPLARATEAHADMEGRRTTGGLVLTV